MILDRINEDYKNAVKSKDEIKRDTLNLLKSAIKYREIELREKNKDLNDEEILSVIQKEVRKRKEAIELYKKGGREDLASKENEEIKILEGYLPEQLSEEELSKMIDEAIHVTLAKNLSDIGKIMKELMPRIRGRADGALVKSIVEKKLSSLE